MSLIKKSLIGLLSLVVLLGIAIGVISLTIDPNNYRAQITEVVKKQTGRELHFDHIELSFFPKLGAHLKKVTLSNAPGFDTRPFLSITQVQVRVALLPLLSKQLKVDTLTLHGLDVKLARNAQGMTNWSDLMQPTAEPTPRSATETNANPLQQLASLSVGGIDVRDGQVQWDDQQTQQKINITDFDFVSSAITFGEFFNIDLNAHAQFSQPQISSQLALSLKVKINQSGTFEIKNIKQSSQLQGKTLPIETLFSEVTIPTLNMDIKQQHIQLPKVYLSYSVKGHADFPAKKLTGNIDITNVSAHLSEQRFATDSVLVQYDLETNDALPINTAKGALTLDQSSFNMAKQSVSSGLLTFTSDLTGAHLPNQSARISVNTQPTLNLQTDSAALSNLKISALNIESNGSVKVTQLTTQPNIQTDLTVNPFDLRNLLNQLNLKLDAVDTMSDPTTLTKVAANLSVNIQTRNPAIQVNDLLVKLDDTTLKGTASLQGLVLPEIAYNLHLDTINVSRYLPPQAPTPVEEQKTVSKTDQKTSAQNNSNTDIEIPLPSELLKSFTLNGTFKADRIQYDTLNPKAILVTVKAKEGLIKVNPIKADLFNTTAFATAQLDVRNKQPKYAFTLNTQNVPIGEVLMTFTQTDPLNGNGAIKANLTSSGNLLSLIKKDLNGTLSAHLKDGAIKGFNLAQSIREAKEKLGGKKSNAPNEPLKTDFSTLESDFIIKNGVLDTQKLLAQAPFMRINGSGTVNLVTEKLDYLVKTKIVATDKGQGGADLKELNGLTIPVKLKGDWHAPAVSLDLGSLIEQKAKEEIKQKIEDKKQDVTKDLEKKLKDRFLKNLPF